MSSRSSILERLRSSRAPLTEAERREGAQRTDMPRPPRDRDVFRDIATSDGELVEQFRERLELLHGEVHVVPDEVAARETLATLIESAEPGPCIAQRDPLVDAVLELDPKLEERFARDERLDEPSPELARYSVGLTSCSALVARTGSVVLQSLDAGGRRISVLPPLHIVLARRGQMLASLDDAVARLEKEGDWSFATIITGPSRTADIEKILVLGAHGPKRLAVVIIGE